MQTLNVRKRNDEWPQSQIMERMRPLKKCWIFLKKTGFYKKKITGNCQRIRFGNVGRAKLKVKTMQREVVGQAVKATDRGCILKELVPKKKVRSQKVASEVMNIFGGL